MAQDNVNATPGETPEVVTPVSSTVPNTAPPTVVSADALPETHPAPPVADQVYVPAAAPQPVAPANTVYQSSTRQKVTLGIAAVAIAVVFFIAGVAVGQHSYSHHNQGNFQNSGSYNGGNGFGGHHGGYGYGYGQGGGNGTQNNDGSGQSGYQGSDEQHGGQMGVRGEGGWQNGAGGTSSNGSNDSSDSDSGNTNQ
jgi:hypothetical protein